LAFNSRLKDFTNKTGLNVNNVLKVLQGCMQWHVGLDKKEVQLLKKILENYSNLK
jgi:hypothetical protein